ncbi:prephenate dehydratase [Oculatella sp. LEGE 06141]|uniref:prephenate dehydratase n=1 Tax=Oculatella sp. LEGE 06141 TaxID=1828648 RepID=UPI001880866D|nr:prephenate dehydratase [Oculatella sp. LEGE 06141]MBE9180779.1 prephenate dehydratase [Oculatella sp. LEGE 06141]
MTLSIAYLGPPGTYTESAAIACTDWLAQTANTPSVLCPCPSIAQTLRVTASGQTHLAVVPVENSIEGSVSMTLDTLWQLDMLRIQQALVLPISHALLSFAETTNTIQTVYSHPQALAQCQGWLEAFLPSVQLVPTNSTTESLQHLGNNPTIGAIAPQRAAQLYNLPVLAHPINDHPDNCTRFWVLSLEPSPGGNYTSLAFSVPANVPGALAKPLQIFAQRGINLSRIESRPQKRSLGDYLFFIDIEADATLPAVQSALAELKTHTETLKIFGSYAVLPVAKVSASSNDS